MPQLDRLEALVEVTGVPDVGARVAYEAIMYRKPVIMMNVETDITIGLYLDRLARRSGALYTVASGDEPGVCKMLCEQALLMGFEVVDPGQGQEQRHRPRRHAGLLRRRGRREGHEPQDAGGLQGRHQDDGGDGRRGQQHGAPAGRARHARAQGRGRRTWPGSSSRPRTAASSPARGCVDYSTGAIAPGVFAVVRSYDKRIRTEMKFITHADGPYYLHFRPYHLCDLETPQSIAEAVLLGEVTATAEAMHAEVVCTAKRDIAAGERLRGIGDTDWYGTLMTYADARAQRAVPIGIGAGAVARRAIVRGSIITEADAIVDESSFVCRLRRLQDSLYA